MTEFCPAGPHKPHDTKGCIGYIYSALQAANKHIKILETNLHKLESKIDIMSSDRVKSRCPTCQRPLTEKQRKEIENEIRILSAGY